jgi:small subunit ribosomal protein S8
MADKIADMLTQIRNAQILSHPRIEIPFSNLKYEIVKMLQREGFVEDIKKKGKEPDKIILIELKYSADGVPAISGLSRISKSSRKVYKPAKKIDRVRGEYGIYIVSTSKGLKTDKEARKENLGGEIICEIW